MPGRAYAYHENNYLEIFLESELKRHFDSSEGLRDQKLQGTDFDGWIHDLVRAGLLVPEQKMSQEERVAASKYLLQEAVSDVENHPFRTADKIDQELARSYYGALDRLSVAWTDAMKIAKKEKPWLDQTTEWVHDWNGYLYRLWSTRLLHIPMKHLIEHVLHMAKNYIATSEVPAYWSTAYVTDENGVRSCVVDKFVLLTKENTGLDIPVLPRYYPMVRSSTDENRIREYVKAHFKNANVDRVMEKWRENDLPILKWINAKIDAAGPELDLWRSVYATEQAMRKEGSL